MNVVSGDLLQVTRILRPLRLLLTEAVTLDFLFEGSIGERHKTKLALEIYVKRYEASIKTLNRAILLNVALVPLVLYPVLVSQKGASFKIPLLGLEVTREVWIQLAPAASFGLQALAFLALAWFFLLRRGLVLLDAALVKTERLGSVGNLLLSGAVGAIWMAFSIRKHLASSFHLFWFVPLAVIMTLALLSPSLLCAYLIVQIFSSGWLWLGSVYSALFVPSLAWSLMLLAVSALAGTREVLEPAPKATSDASRS